MAALATWKPKMISNLLTLTSDDTELLAIEAAASRVLEREGIPVPDHQAALLTAIERLDDELLALIAREHLHSVPEVSAEAPPEVLSDLRMFESSLPHPFGWATATERLLRRCMLAGLVTDLVPLLCAASTPTAGRAILCASAGTWLHPVETDELVAIGGALLDLHGLDWWLGTPERFEIAALSALECWALGV